MTPGEDEIVLPFTPTHTGRRSKIGYLGIEGADFSDLWPLFGGVIASVALLMMAFIGGDFAGLTLGSRLGVCLGPTLAGYGYLRGFVQGRPPHFKADLWARLTALRVDPTGHACAAVPFLPVIDSRLGCPLDPLGWSEGPHPLASAHEQKEGK